MRLGLLEFAYLLTYLYECPPLLRLFYFVLLVATPDTFMHSWEIVMFHSKANLGPNNTIAMVNTTTVLRCRSNQTVTWKFLAVGKSDSEDNVYHRSNVTSDYEKSMYVNRTDDGQYDLCINETKPTNAGTYFCVCGNEEFRAQLIVIGETTLVNTYFD